MEARQHLRNYKMHIPTTPACPVQGRFAKQNAWLHGEYGMQVMGC
jgi:hypothetical protein